MTSVFGFLEEFEKLAYRLLLLTLMIPRTFFMVVLYPRWARVYVKHQLRKDKDSPFDEYLSPVLLLLAIFILPALGQFVLPQYGVEVQEPALGARVEGSTVDFLAEATFISNTGSMYHEFVWTVEKIEEDEEGLYQLDEDGNYVTQVKNEIHSEFESSNRPQERLHFIGGNVVQDHLKQSFLDSKGNRLRGGYVVSVTAANLSDPVDTNTAQELYTSEPIFVLVPEDEWKEISVSTFGFRQVEEGNKAGAGDAPPDAASYLQDERNILVAFSLLFMPLLFAAVTKYRPGQTLSQTALRENFYVQCYYFSPVILSIWAYTFYLTTGIFSPVLGEGLYSSLDSYWFAPFLITLLWFVGVETDAIAKERGVSRLKSFLITIGLLALIGVGLYFYLEPPTTQTLLEYGFKSYPVLFGLSLILYGVLAFRRWKAKSKRRFYRLAYISLMTILGLGVAVAAIRVTGESIPPEELVIDENLLVDAPPDATIEPMVATELPAEPVTVSNTATVPATESASYYTEDFDTNLESWRSYYARPAHEQMVTMNLGESALSFQIFPEDEQKPQVYVVNEAFVYADVRVDAIVVNNGNNANEVSLACRIGETGWYEFGVSNAGLYSIYAVDLKSPTGQPYRLLSNGGSGAIKTGKTTNTYTAICRGNELSLYANGTLVETVTEDRLNLPEGYIGIGASAPQSLPVDVQFESLTVSEP